MPISLVIADDHPLVLGGLEALLATQPDLSVVARCADGEAALEAVERLRPDVLVLDLRMPQMNGLDVLRQLKDKALPTRTVMLTAAIDEDEAVELLRLGVRGVVLKEMAPQLLVQCIRRVHEGGLWIERTSMARALERVLRREDAERAAAAVLTPRELDVVRCVAQGLRNKEIARRLGINEGTVKLHLHHIYEKLGIDGRVALILHAREKGLA